MPRGLGLALPDRFFPTQRKTGKSGLATRDYLWVALCIWLPNFLIIQRKFLTKVLLLTQLAENLAAIKMSAESVLCGVEEGLHVLTITSEHPSSHRRYAQLLPSIPVVTCLKIPNKFFVAADNIRTLRKLLKRRIPSLIELVNETVEEGGDKIRKDARKVEERLNLKLRRWVLVE